MTENNHPDDEQPKAAVNAVAVDDKVEPAPDARRADSKSDPPPVKQRMTMFQKLELAVTSIGVLVGIFVLIIYAKQLSQMRRSVDEIVRQTPELQKSAKAAQDAAKAAGDNATAAKDQAKAALAAVTRADRANQLTELSARQALEAARLDQRPWLGIHHCSFDKEPGIYPTAPNGSLRPTFTQDEIDATAVRLRCGLFNTGRTPALSVLSRFQYRLGDIPNLDWNRLEAPTSIGVSFPNNDQMFLKVDKFIMPPERSQLYQRGTRLFVRFRVEYVDINKRRHWSESCFSRKLHDTLTEFEYCGGGTDQEGQQGQSEDQPY